MRKNLPIEFRSKKKVTPNHLLFTWIFFPFFIIDLVVDEFRTVCVKLFRNSIVKVNQEVFDLTELKKNGFYKIRKFLTINEIEKLNKVILKQKELELKKGSIRKKEVEGSIRFRFTNQPSDEIKEILRFQELEEIYSTYTLKIPKITWMESLTNALKKNQLIFANHPHIDSYRHQLKFVISMEDVSISNGPTEYLGGTQFFNIKLLICYFLTWIYEKKIIKGQKQFLPRKIIEEYKLRNKKLFLMKKGDLVIFDSRGIHRGSEIEIGTRRLLWLYFD